VLWELCRCGSVRTTEPRSAARCSWVPSGRWDAVLAACLLSTPSHRSREGWARNTHGRPPAELQQPGDKLRTGVLSSQRKAALRDDDFESSPFRFLCFCASKTCVSLPCVCTLLLLKSHSAKYIMHRLFHCPLSRLKCQPILNTTRTRQQC
jgi:hypothetical protein